MSAEVERVKTLTIVSQDRTIRTLQEVIAKLREELETAQTNEKQMIQAYNTKCAVCCLCERNKNVS